MLENTKKHTMLKRLGLSGAKRLRAALEPRLTHCSTVNADGLGSSTTGSLCLDNSFSRACQALGASAVEVSLAIVVTSSYTFFCVCFRWCLLQDVQFTVSAL